MSESTATSPTVAVAVNPNPTIERTVAIDELTIGGVNRIKSSIVAAGGKGATVARVLGQLGQPAICVGPLGAQVGRQFAHLAEAENLHAEWTWVEGETRTNTTVVSANSEIGDTLLNEAGPTLTTTEWESLCDAIYGHVASEAPVSISGSTPPGVSGAQLADLVRGLHDRGARVYVDSHGMALPAMIEQRPWCVKVNDDEAAQLLNIPLESGASVREAAQQLSELVSGLAIVTRGAHGATIADTEGLVAHISPPTIRFVSGVGSGDCFLAGLIAGLHAHKMSTIEAVKYASAAGALNAESMTQGRLAHAAVAAATSDTEVQVFQSAGGR